MDDPVQCPACDRWVLNPSDMDDHLATHRETITLTTAGMGFLRFLVTEFEQTNGRDADPNLYEVKAALYV